MKIKCPVCKQAMTSIHKNNTYSCVSREEYISEFKASVEYSHATVHVDNEGNQIIKRIDVLPYSFQIIDQGEVKQTRIMKVSKRAAPPPGQDYKKKASIIFGDLRLDQETLIVVPNAINIEWKDKKQVEERVKMYMLFS